VTLIALASAKGSPGVTTLALALAHVWPRPVLLAECDPAGGDIAAGYLAGAADPGRNLLDLTVAARRTDLDSALRSHLVALDDSGSRSVLPGLRGPEQAAAVASWWGRIAAMFADLHDLRELHDLRDGDDPSHRHVDDRANLGGTAAAVDVLADCGRLAADHPPTAVLRRADVAVLVMRPTLRSISHARVAVHELATSDPPGRQRLLAVVVGADKPYSTRDVRQALQTPVAQFADDPRAAAVLSDGAPAGRRFVTSALLRSARTLADELCAATAQRAPGRQSPSGSEALAASNGKPMATTLREGP
jgi:hypothetical protein